MALYTKAANLTPIEDSAQLGLACETATALTVPDGAKVALIQAETQDLRWLDDGNDPAADEGMLLEAGKDFFYNGDLTKIKLIAAVSGGVANILFYA
jgi:hypothetical protein